MAEIEETTLSKIKIDQTNPNQHTERGKVMIRKSIHKYGFAEAGTLDKNNRLIGGNLRTEASTDLGMDEAIIVDIDGTKPVYTRRKDLDLSNPDDTRAKELAWTLNQTALVSIDFDPEVLAADIAAGVDFSGIFTEDEQAEILQSIPDIDFPEYDETVKDEVKYIECPHCGETFPK
jgi:hypothetical protein